MENEAVGRLWMGQKNWFCGAKNYTEFCVPLWRQDDYGNLDFTYGYGREDLA